MPKKDYQTMDKCLSIVADSFTGDINITEIGVFQGNTSRGMKDFFWSVGRKVNYIGVDNQRDFKMDSPFKDAKFIIGNSFEVYNQIPDNSQHFIFIDGNHSYPVTMVDFLVYSDKVVDGGYIAFHDTGAQIKPFTDFQGIGDMADPDMWIACRKAVNKLGLLDNKFEGWVKVLDEYDENFHTGGILLVKKDNNKQLYEQYMTLP